TAFQRHRSAHFRHLALAGRDRSHHPDGLSPHRPLESWRLEPAGRAEALPGHRRCLVPYLFLLRTHKHLFRSAEEHVEERGRQWSRGKAITILLIATALVALLSEFLVGTIENVRDSVGLTEVFV